MIISDDLGGPKTSSRVFSAAPYFLSVALKFRSSHCQNHYMHNHNLRCINKLEWRINYRASVDYSHRLSLAATFKTTVNYTCLNALHPFIYVIAGTLWVVMSCEILSLQIASISSEKPHHSTGISLNCRLISILKAEIVDILKLIVFSDPIS